MKLTIKSKLLGMIILTVFLLLSGLSVTVWINMKGMALDTHETNSRIELELITQYIGQIVTSSKESAALLAESTALKGAVKDFPKYNVPGAPDVVSEADENESMASAINLWRDMMKSYKNLSSVFAAMEDAGYYQYPGGNIGSGYDPRVRSWYTQGKASPTDVMVTKAYQSTAGIAVIDYIAKVRNANGQFAGLVGVDIELGTMTKMIGDIKIGKTGYVVLMETDGTILAEPKHEKFVFTKAADSGVEGIIRAGESKGGMFEAGVDGKPCL